MKIRILILAVLSGGFVASCGGSEDAGQTSQHRGVTADTITVGIHTDMSGQLAIWGVPSVHGMRMRFKELADAGGVHGRTIELVAEDSQYQVPAAVKATNKLLNVDDVFVMLGALGTPHNNAVIDSVLEAGVPNLFPLTAAVSMYEPLHPMKFSYFVSYREQTRGGIRFFVEQHDVSRVCLQTLATDYGAEVEIGFNLAAEEYGLDVVYVGRHKGSETDFAGTVTSIKNSGCELLFLGPFIKDAILIYTSARDAGWDGIIAGNMVPYVPEVAKAADGRMEGFYASAPFLFPDFETTVDDEWVASWYASYVEEFGTEPAAQSVIGYVMADLLVIALEAAGPDPTAEKLVKALEGISHYDDPFGGPSLSFSAHKHMGGNALNLYQVQDRKWVTVAESLPY